MTEWNEDAHPRDANGRFAGGVAGWAGHLTGKAFKQGGFTMKPGDKTPTSGIMVSRDPKEGHGHVIEIAQLKGMKNEKELRAHVEQKVSAWLEKAMPSREKLGEDHYLGGWLERAKDGSPVALHLDISQRFSEKNEAGAIKAGRERNQLAVWHIGGQREIDTGGTGR